MTKKFVTTTVLNKDERVQLSEAWMQMVNCITHDIITPLVTARIATESIGEILPDLIKGYLLAVKHKLIARKFSEKRLKILEKKSVSNITQEITKIIDFLKLLFPYNQKLLSGSKDTASLSALTYIDEILEKYPFSNKNQRKGLQVNDSYNFTLNMIPPFTDRLFFHLLDNALGFIRHEGKGDISIWAEEEENYQLIHFKDTAKGIDRGGVEQVFYHFFSKREGEIVPGLGFCRLAFLQSGGDIICHSVEGDYTDFIIKFPKAAGL